MSEVPRLELTGIEKSFPGVKALENVSFSVRRGTVHVLCGENGAGKSTLMKIINGIYQPDAGVMRLDGQVVRINNAIEARKHRISMIFQELNYIPELTIEQTMFLGREPVNSLGKIDWKKIRRDTLQLFAQEKLDYKPDTQMKELSISDIQMLEIVKAISYDADVIIMDEPTSAITQREVERLFDKINVLRSRGASIIYISHKLDEIFKIADEITVLRDGTVVGSYPKSELDIDKVITMMVGRVITNSYPKEEVKLGDKILEVQDLQSPGVFQDISFHVRAGEIVGFAGLMGAGRTEVMRTLFGLDHYSSGQVQIEGRGVRINRVSDSINSRLVMLSEDRRRYGLIPVRSIRENISLATLSQFIYMGFLHEKKENESINEICQKMRVKAPDWETTVEALSGGNQQKVVLAKWMVRDPAVLIMDEPTRGIDVGAKVEIYKLMSALAHEGKGLVMVSSELPELMGMCDRIYVMSQGKITGELERSDFSQEAIMRLATANSTVNEATMKFSTANKTADEVKRSED